jgi:DNA phosphorothioation-dependent restriction protein DptG
MTEFQPKPQTPEQVDEGLRNAFRQAIKDGVMDATPYFKQMTFNTDIQKTEAEIKVLQKKLELLKEIETHKSKKPETLYDIIADWWEDVFTKNSNDDIENCIGRLVYWIEEWLPKEQSAAGSQNAYVECTVEGFNDCLNRIKRKLR